MLIKKLFLSWVLLAFLSPSLNAQNTYYIPDSAFAVFLKSLVPDCMSGRNMDTFCVISKGISKLTLSKKGFQNIDGIQFFKSLTHLTCDYNKLEKIPPLPESLEFLTINNNLLREVDHLPKNLLYLKCDSNQITSIDLFPPKFLTLICQDNLLQYLPTLSKTMAYLECFRNRIQVLPELPPTMSSLSCDANQLSYLPTLPDNLSRLNCGENQLTFLPRLPSNLTILTCEHNALTGLPQLPNKLSTLFAYNNSIYCFPHFPLSLKNNCFISNNPATCVPNHVQGMDAYAKSLPLCVENDSINNPHGCDSMGNETTSVDTLQKLTPAYQIVPNPNSGTFVLFNNKAAHERAEGIIYNQFGQEVLHFTLTSQEEAIELRNQVAGLYYVIIQSEKQKTYLKFIMY